MIKKQRYTVHMAQVTFCNHSKGNCTSQINLALIFSPILQELDTQLPTSAFGTSPNPFVEKMGIWGHFLIQIHGFHLHD